MKEEKDTKRSKLEDKILYRIIKVLHVIAYVFFAFYLLVILFGFGRDYHSATNSYSWNIGNSLLTLFLGSIIGIIIIELIYKAIFYIIFGKKITHEK